MSRHMCVGMAEVSNWRVEGRRFCDAWKPRSKGKADEEEEKAWEGRLSSIEGQPQVRQPSVAGDPGEDPGEMQRKASYRWQPPAQHAGTRQGQAPKAAG